MSEKEASMATNSSSQESASALQQSSDQYQSVESYPWVTDPDFQSGLAAILGSNASTDQAQIEDLTLLARCFYYQRYAWTFLMTPYA